MSLSDQDRVRISNAVRAVEDKTSGEIVCVLAQTSSDARALPMFLASVMALASPWLLVAFTTMTVYRILAFQVAVFVALLVLLCMPQIRVLLMPRRAQRAAAYQAAREQFVVRGIARKKDRCGILIFVSLAERYARIIPDEGIAARVPQADWQAAIDALIAHMREERIAEGFIAAIELCGEKLVQHFPRTETKRDELPDRIYLI